MAFCLIPTLGWNSDRDSITVFLGGDSLRLARSYSFPVPGYSDYQDSILNVAREPVSTSPQDGLMAKGSISRGLQVSTNASVSLQSSMYLQVEGTIGNDINVSGTLSEKSSPLQPIGNTRRLNDFDRVLIRLTSPTLFGQIGDIDLNLDHGTFGQFKRNIEGLALQTTGKLLHTETALGFSYGVFHVLDMQGRDGKQGPYRFTGKNGEKFIIILAGSEHVYLDGKRLTRGADQDYVIDYNAAELHFTQSNLISGNSRISMEFEYVPDIYLSNYSFGKQVLVAEAGFGKKGRDKYVNLAWHSLRDDAKQPIGAVDADSLRRTFESLPDTVSSIWHSGIRADSIAGNYDLVDGILIYAGEAAGSVTAKFTFVGLTSGNYRRVQVGDLSYFVYDEALGEYTPAQQWIAPQAHDLWTLQGGLIQKHLFLDAEWAGSRTKANMYALESIGTPKQALDLRTGVDREFVGLSLGLQTMDQGFRTHDPMLTTEAYRRWQIAPRRDEQEAWRSARLRIGQSAGDYVTGGINSLVRNDRVWGNQADLNVHTDSLRSLQFQSQHRITDLDTLESQYHHLLVRSKWSKLTADIFTEVETGNRNLEVRSRDHWLGGATFKLGLAAEQSLALSLQQRRDFLNNRVQPFWSSQGWEKRWIGLQDDIMLGYYFNSLLGLHGKMELKYREQMSDTAKTGTYMLGTGAFQGSWLDDRLQLEQNLVLDEEHLPRFEYHYLKVDTGYGSYSYDPNIRDYIPVPGGRFVRQRIFSDREEQVRKIQNRTRWEYRGKDFETASKTAARLIFQLDQSRQTSTDDDKTVQDRQGLNLTYEVKPQGIKRLELLKLNAADNRSSSNLYSYGNESTTFSEFSMQSNFIPAQNQKMGLTFKYEIRDRDLEYNPLAKESWIASRIRFDHFMMALGKQQIKSEIRYSRVQDQRLSLDYSEVFLGLNHRWRMGKRASLDQGMDLALIHADAVSIPYSIFSGRQPGTNWKYTMNGRYRFSSRFQLRVNYSIRERGENALEQYLNVEGRTLF